MTAPEPSAVPVAGGSASRTVRRLIVYTILFALVTIAAIGIAGLLERLLDLGDRLVVGGTGDLALSLAFTLIGGPLAAVLWWVSWRRLADESERSSLAWGLYLAGMYTVSLIVATSALVGTASALVGGRWLPGDFSAGVVWAGVWAWHRWMWRHPLTHPTRLATVPAVAGTVFGLVIGVRGAVSALGSLLDTAIRGASEQALAGRPWWQVTIEALIWAVAGGLVWWWHWFRDDARRLRTGLAAVALVAVGVLGSGVVMLGGLGTALFVVLRLLFDRGDPASEILRPLGTSIAAAAVGALVWVYHRRIASQRSDGTRRASTLVMSGVGLAAAASGIGVIVNSTLATLVGPLAASDTRAAPPRRDQRARRRRTGVVVELEAHPPGRVDGARRHRSPGLPHRRVRGQRNRGAHRPAHGRLPRVRVLARPARPSAASSTAFARRSASSSRRRSCSPTTSPSGGTTAR